MTLPDGGSPQDNAEKSLGEIVAEVSEKASLLVREEIELAKAEVTDKVRSLTRGAAVAGAAGFVLLRALVVFLSALSWFFVDLYDTTSIWLGFLTTFGILIGLAALSGFLAYRWFKKGSPPTPELAIEEARRTRAELERQTVQRDQLGRTLERGEAS